jgi:predicted transposase YdaD
VEKPVPQNKEDTYIQWHPALVAALQLELEQYKDVLQFIPEYQLTPEPLRIDVVIIKKSKDVVIDKNFAAMFQTDNIVEYKSPESYVSVKDFYKVYGYACLYANLNDVPITEITITFVENHYPRDLLAHLEEVRGCHVEEKTAGIYTVIGDIFPIQIIDSRQLSADENLWLKDLNDTLDLPEIQRLIDESQQRKQDVLVPVYLGAIYKANTEKIKEMIKMTGPITSVEDFACRIIEDLGYGFKLEEAKERAKEEAKERAELKAKQEVAKNALARGFPVEDVAEITGFSLETVQGLAQK